MTRETPAEKLARILVEIVGEEKGRIMAEAVIDYVDDIRQDLTDQINNSGLYDPYS